MTSEILVGINPAEAGRLRQRNVLYFDKNIADFSKVQSLPLAEMMHSSDWTEVGNLRLNLS